MSDEPERDWYDKYKGMEQAWMVLKDQYSEVARALGFEGNAWFGDPLAEHKKIVEVAKELRSAQLERLPNEGQKFDND